MGLVGSILGQKQRVQFILNDDTVIQFDASIKEIHGRNSPISKFPIENGQIISDNIILEPHTLELTGMITDTPIGGIQGLLTETITSLTSALTPPVGIVAIGAGQALFSTLANSESPSVAAYGQLLQLQANGQPFDVLTSLFRYENMAITSISVPRDADTGSAILFTVTLSELILVSPQSVNIGIFANPAMSANLADSGQQSLAASQAKAGYFAGLNFSGGSTVK